MNLSQIMSELGPIMSDAFAIYESPANSASAQADALARVEAAVVPISPKVAKVVSAAVPFAVAVSQHPQPATLVSAGLNLAMSLFGSSFSF
jgi:hypothetical protein